MNHPAVVLWTKWTNQIVQLAVHSNSKQKRRRAWIHFLKVFKKIKRQIQNCDCFDQLFDWLNDDHYLWEPELIIHPFGQKLLDLMLSFGRLDTRRMQLNHGSLSVWTFLIKSTGYFSCECRNQKECNRRVLYFQSNRMTQLQLDLYKQQVIIRFNQPFQQRSHPFMDSFIEQKHWHDSVPVEHRIESSTITSFPLFQAVMNCAFDSNRFLLRSLLETNCVPLFRCWYAEIYGSHVSFLETFVLGYMNRFGQLNEDTFNYPFLPKINIASYRQTYHTKELPDILKLLLSEMVDLDVNLHHVHMSELEQQNVHIQSFFQLYTQRKMIQRVQLSTHVPKDLVNLILQFITQS